MLISYITRIIAIETQNNPCIVLRSNDETRDTSCKTDTWSTLISQEIYHQHPIRCPSPKFSVKFHAMVKNKQCFSPGWTSLTHRAPTTTPPPAPTRHVTLLTEFFVFFKFATYHNPAQDRIRMYSSSGYNARIKSHIHYSTEMGIND